ncbi:hypothetical protein BV378_01800 [Nostoc sp. RF31YmG]|nr:hypothetical protein BV378_01800 [Nostoc sp. RF31YmG]
MAQAGMAPRADAPCDAGDQPGEGRERADAAQARHEQQHRQRTLARRQARGCAGRHDFDAPFQPPHAIAAHAGGTTRR